MFDKVEYNKAWLRTHPGARERYRRKLLADCAVRLYNALSTRVKENLLTLEWIREHVAPMRCEATGMTLRWDPDRRFDLLAPSIDRIDPEDGYWSGNCRIVSWGLNCLRGAHPDSDLQEWLKSLPRS